MVEPSKATAQSNEVALEMTKTIRRMVETDERLLYDLYRFRILTRDQIERLYFEGSKWYTYHKMYIMKNSGYVNSRIIMRNKPQGKERTAIYFITDKGIRELRDRGWTDEEVEAKDLQIERQNMEGYLEFNDLYVELRDQGYTFIDSRTLKKKYQMERGDLCKGAMVTPDGTEFLVYIVRSGAREQTLRRILKEMNRSYEQMTRRNNLVLFRGSDSFELFQNLHLESMEQEGSKILDSIYALPYTYALTLFKYLKTEQDYLKLFTKYGQMYRNSKAVEKHKSYLIHHDGHEKYAINLLMNDLTLIDRIKRERWDRQAVLFVFTDFIDVVSERLKGVRQVEIIEITDEELMSC